MDFLKKIKNLNFEKTDVNKNILHNTYFLYFISFLSFGKFFFEMMTGDMYYVSVYIIIAFLITFFNKNMIVILSLSLIFANILKYGRASTYEGFDDDHENNNEENEVDKALGMDDESQDDGVIDKMMEEKDSKKKEKSKKTNKKEETERQIESYEENDDDDGENEDEDEDKPEKKKTKKTKKTKEKFTEKELKNMEYKESEKLLENQKLLLKNMKEYKPFLDTIQGLAKNVSGFVKNDSE